MSDDSWSSGASDTFDNAADVGSAGEEAVQSQSFWERLMASLTGILVGIVLVGAAAFGLFWNEGRAVETAKALTEGAGQVQTVGADRVDPARNGRLIHLSGPATARGDLRDGDLGITTRGLRLVRKVEMYQWEETRRTETRDGQRVTVYDYRQTWSERAIDSGSFRRRDGHQNPRMPLSSRTVSAEDARIGAFQLTQTQIGGISPSADRSFAVPQDALAGIAARLGPQARIVDGRIVVAADEANPRVGDLRVTYTVLPEGPVSVVGKQTAAGVERYTASNGRDVFLITAGERTAGQMFNQAQDDNRVLTWILRVVGLIALWIGFMLIFGPFVVLAEAIPLLGGLLAAGIGLAAAFLALLVGVPVVALAWLWYRPILAGGILAGGIVALIGVRWLAARRQASKTAARAVTGHPPTAQPQMAPGFTAPPAGGAFLPPQNAQGPVPFIPTGGQTPRS